jgi:hypothetical protein
MLSRSWNCSSCATLTSNSRLSWKVLLAGLPCKWSGCKSPNRLLQGICLTLTHVGNRWNRKSKLYNPLRFIGALLTCHRVNRRSPSMTVFHPQSLWTSNFLNSCQKTQQLYTFIKSLDQPLLSPPPETLTEKYRSVCMTYGGWAERDIHMITEQIHEETKWFVRDLGAQPVKAPEAAQAIKRTQDGSDDTSKRRRVRQGKQTDVGSLLMAFK